jgi:hypothetical protein
MTAASAFTTAMRSPSSARSATSLATRPRMQSRASTTVSASYSA